MGRGDDLTSPDLQEQAVRRYCARLGYDPVAWLCDIDMSGRSWSRRKVEQAVRMVEDGNARVIVVPRWSRFTRNLRDYVIQVARIEAAGGRLESALEEADPATAAGLLQRDLFAILAQWESRLRGEQWRETVQRRHRAGLHHSPKAQLGYRLIDRRYVPDRHEAPIVVELYARYLAGAGGTALTQWLESVGVHSRITGGRWTPGGLRNMMNSGFAAGLLRVGDSYLPGAHLPLITMPTWQAYLDEVHLREPFKRKQTAHFAPLADLVRCAGCHRLMHVRDDPRPKPRGGLQQGYLYLCDSNRPCPNRACITRARLEKHVRQWLFELAEDLEAGDTAGAEGEGVDRATETQLRQELARLEAALIRNRVDFAVGDYDATTRDKIADMLHQRRGSTLRRLGEAQQKIRRRTLNPRSLRHTAATWDQTPAPRLNATLKQIIEYVEAERLPGRHQYQINVAAV
jgi:site-specific DNA recombinase